MPTRKHIQPGEKVPLKLTASERKLGGTGGYEEYLEALADPAHENHKDFLRWRGK